MGSNFVGHNTGEMRNWSDDMGNLSQEYDNLIRNIQSSSSQTLCSKDPSP